MDNDGLDSPGNKQALDRLKEVYGDAAAKSMLEAYKFMGERGAEVLLNPEVSESIIKINNTQLVERVFSRSYYKDPKVLKKIFKVLSRYEPNKRDAAIGFLETGYYGYGALEILESDKVHESVERYGETDAGLYLEGLRNLLFCEPEERRKMASSNAVAEAIVKLAKAGITVYDDTINSLGLIRGIYEADIETQAAVLPSDEFIETLRRYVDMGVDQNVISVVKYRIGKAAEQYGIDVAVEAAKILRTNYFVDDAKNECNVAHLDVGDLAKAKLEAARSMKYKPAVLEAACEVALTTSSFDKKYISEDFFKGICNLLDELGSKHVASLAIDIIGEFSRDLGNVRKIFRLSGYESSMALMEAMKEYKKEVRKKILSKISERIDSVQDKEKAVQSATKVLKMEEFLKEAERREKLSSYVINSVLDAALLTSEPSVARELLTATAKYDEKLLEGIAYGLGTTDVRPDKNEENEMIDFTRRIIKVADSLHQKDPETAAYISAYTPCLWTVFGDKKDFVFDYLEKRRDRSGVIAIATIKNREKVTDAIKKIKMKSSGNKSVDRLIKFASYLDYNYSLGLAPKVSEDLQASFDDAEESLVKYMKDLGIEPEKGLRFISWIPTKSETAMKVLRGESIEKRGERKSYRLKESEVDLNGIKRDLESYAKQVGVQIPNDLGAFTERIEKTSSQEEKEDATISALSKFKSVAEQIMSGISKNKNLKEGDVREIKPNLGRILNMTYKGSRRYQISFDPSDLESQLQALQGAESCLSPGGSNFKYTEEYLKNPNTFWATIREENKEGMPGKVVGRATIFRGKQDGKDVIAKVSRVYSTAPVGEDAVDEALKKYADEIGLDVIKDGEMKVEGLEKVYDDFVSGSDGNVELNMAAEN